MRVLYLLIFFPLFLFAQPTQRTTKGWKELTISDGLSQGMIYDLKQDQNGFVWVATKDGLNRYDGHNFTVFTHDPYNEYSLSDNACSALLIDSRGRLWVGTLNQGLNLYDAQTQRFYHIDISDRQSTNAGNYEVRLLAEDPEGNIWVNTDQDKLFKITLPTELKTSFPKVVNFTSQATFQQITLAGMATNATAHHIQFETDGRAIVGTTYGMCLFNWRHMTGMQAINRPPGLSQKDWSLVDDAGAGEYWFSAMNTYIHSWRGATHKAIHLPSQTTSVLVKLLDANTVAIATLEYLWLMSPAQLLAQESLTPQNAFTAMPPDMYGLRTMTKDKTGLIWVGTAGYGLRVFNPKVKQFKTYLPNTSLAYLTQDQQGRSYARYSSTYGRIDEVTNKLVPFLNGIRQSNDYHVDFLMQSKAGDFWVSTIDFGVAGKFHQLLRYSSKGALLNHYPLPAQTAFGINQNQTLEDKAGQLWIGATNGKLLRFDPVTESFTVFSYSHLLPQRGAEIETSALYFDQTGTLWIGTPRGLVRADHPQTKPSFSLYKNSPADRQSLSNDVVSSMVDDPYEPLRYLWVSTKGGGLERLDKHARSASAGQFRHFTEAQGLPNKVVYGILVDAFKNLWMSTNRGLAQFNPRTFAFRNFTKADGLQDDEFNTGSFVKGASGKLLFGGINGLTEFNPRDVAGKTTPPQAHIVGLKINNEPVTVGSPDGILSQSIERIPAIDLSYDQNGVTLEFAVMDFTNPAKNRYRYRLKGIDDNWVAGGTNRFANYAQLPDGNYTLQMMGSSDGQSWSKPVELQIRVHPPLYRTWWAYLFYAIIIGVSGWQLYRVQTQRLLLEQRLVYEQKEASRLSELDGLKTQFFTNISHEFRTPLTLILGPLTDLTKRLPGEPLLALMERNGQRLLSLINQLLDLSKLEAGQLKAEPDWGDMAAFFRTLAASFSSLADSRQIGFTFSQNRQECPARFDRDKLEKIVSNLLANAFKFTPAGNEVRMSVHYVHSSSSSHVQLTIEDTGIGIAAEHVGHIFERFYQADGRSNRAYEGTGIGLALVHELVKVLGGNIDVTSTEGVGTTFIVTLPLEAREEASRESVPVTAKVGSPAVVSFGEGLDSQPEEPAASGAIRDGAENLLLIIDDNADIRAYLKSIFAADYQILEASDGVDGLEKATASLPDLVICDLMMPRLDGFGFCKVLKSQEATSHIPVVMLTAKATVEDRIEGFELGADDYLTKPFNRAEMQARVRNLVQQRQRLFQRLTALTSQDSVDVEPGASAEPTLLKAEQEFIDRLGAVVLQHIDQADFTVEMLAENVNLSRTQLHRKLRAVANLTATSFIRNIRLAKATELLSNGEENVSQVAYAVGFDNLSYFAKVFQERYGVLPSQYSRTSHGRVNPDRTTVSSA
ncbi:ATP-binding protein [Spirosoma soli]|uniref:histidine kinase n=1 Tax=Spirosoma soli TaxID=1770529 RepID=A0ABW5M8B2_9BACT